jgi:hypothetical protein
MTATRLRFKAGMAFTRNDKKEPRILQEMALRAFAERGVHDATSLSFCLFGDWPRGRLAKAYHTVCKDVLEYMERQGLLEVAWAGLVPVARCRRA